MRDFLPIILGSDENAYACARMFYEINGERSLVFCSKGLVQTSFSGILLRYVIEDFDTPSIFKAVLTTALPKLKNHAKKLLLIPCSDYYSALAIWGREWLSEYISNAIIPSYLYDKIKDKIAFKNLCEGMGISHPQTEITLPSAILSKSTARKFPLVCKPANSNSFEYLHGEGERKKVYFCEDETELTDAARILVESGYNNAVVLQEYIGGGEKYSRVVNAYCDKNSRVRLIGAGEPLLEYKSDRLIGNYAAIKCVKDRALCDEAADILEKIGYVGFANFDVKINPENGKYYFLELNPRQGRSSYFIRVAGENLMGQMYEDIVLEKPYEGRRYAEGGGVWINEPIGVIKREMKRHGLDADGDIWLGKTALDVGFDFSLPRAISLIKRQVGSFLRPI